MQTRQCRPLLTWDQTPGFLCDWHLLGFFDAGLQHNPNPSLFDKKHSLRWTDDLLAPWGGCTAVRELPGSGTADAMALKWDLIPLSWHPELSLNLAREDFPAWEERLAGADSNGWDKLYYALALVESPRRMDARLLFSGWDGCRLWINGCLAFEEHSYHHTVFDMEQVPFTIEKGLNSFLFQLDRDGAVARIDVPGSPDALGELRSVAAGPAPAARTISTFAQLRCHAFSLKMKTPFDGAQPLGEWQRRFHEHFERCLGPAPGRPAHAENAELAEETACDGYTRRRYHVPCEGESMLPCCVLIPDKARRNGRTLIHPHGHESRFGMVAGIKPHTGPRIFTGEWTGNYAERLARKGFVTAVMCQRAFEERRDYFGIQDPCNEAHLRALAMGFTLPRLHIADLHRLHELVSSLPEVDSSRIGLAGISGGGTLAYLAGAFDERFKAVAVFCALCRYTDYAATGGCGMQVVPGLYPEGDTGEVLSLIAPRPLLLGQGRLDSTFNVIRFRSIAGDVRRAYRAADVEDRLEAHIYELAHQFDVDLAERFFLKWL